MSVPPAGLSAPAIGLNRRGLRLAWFTIGYNVVEGLVAVAAGVLAGLVSLVGFGIDSGIESMSAVLVAMRLSARLRHGRVDEAKERRALRLVAITFFLLAGYVTIAGVRDLIAGEMPDTSPVGIAVLVASSRFGLRDVRERLDPFATYARLLSSLSPFWRTADNRIRVRVPLLSANRDVPAEPGLAALGTLLIGSVSYDGLTRTDWWSERVALAAADLARDGIDPDTARIAFGSFGLVMLLLLAWGAFELAVWCATKLGKLVPSSGTRVATLFVPSLLPIALAYVVAHYFSFFVVQVQDLARLASDPFEQGWNLFGTANRRILDLWIPSGTLIWMVQVVSIIVGHVAGLLLAHDRALELAPDARRANRSQLPMLALMLLYTITGMYFLSEGLQ